MSQDAQGAAQVQLGDIQGFQVFIKQDLRQ
jgi:hypothetical protein